MVFLSLSSRVSRQRRTETDRDRQRQTETDRDRQSQTETDRQLGRQLGRQPGRQAGKEAGREAGRQTDRQAGRQTDRQAGRQAGRQRDRQPSGRSSLRSCFEGVGAALWSWFLVGSEGDVRHWGPLPAGAFRPLEPWCFAVLQPPARSSLWSCFQGVGAALWSWFLVGSEGDVRHWDPLPAGAFRPC